MEDQIERKMRKYLKHVKKEKFYKKEMLILLRREFVLETQGHMLKDLFLNANEHLTKVMNLNFFQLVKTKKNIANVKRRAWNKKDCDSSSEGRDSSGTAESLSSISSDSEPCFSLNDSFTAEDDKRFMDIYF